MPKGKGGTVMARPVVDSQVSAGAGMSVEIATLRSIALQQPRNEKKIAEKSLQELEMFPEFAEKAFYSIPFKKREKGPNGKYTEKIVYVEGNSIKAAMSLTRKWGNCLTLGRILSQDEERITVAGIFYDAETNMFTVRSLPVSRVYIDARNGTVIPLKEDRLKKAIAAEMSKAVRNAALASLPEALTEAYFSKAKTIAAQVKGNTTEEKQKSFTERLQTMRDKFEEVGVDRKILGEFLLKDKSYNNLKTDEEKIARMIGIYNSIKDGQAQAHEYFGEFMKTEEEKKAETEKNPTDTSMEDLFPGEDVKDGKG